MLLLLPLLLILLAIKCNSLIRTNNIIFYVIATILSALTFILYDYPFFSLIANGYVALSFILVIMYTGALPKGSYIKGKLQTVRKEYAVLSFIFILAHALLHIYNVLTGIAFFEVFGFLTLLFMIPLLLSSFPSIRKKIRTSKWIQVHRLAYLVYALLFIHLLMVSTFPHIILYTLLFSIYFFMKLYQYVFKTRRFLYSSLCTILFILTSLLISLPSYEYNYVYIDYVEDQEFVDGTYYGSSEGYRNQITSVYVTIENNTISNITLEECGCTPYAANGLYLDAAYSVANDIVFYNQTDVDSISGATVTSISVNEAVIDALTKAKK